MHHKSFIYSLSLLCNVPSHACMSYDKNKFFINQQKSIYLNSVTDFWSTCTELCKKMTVLFSLLRIPAVLVFLNSQVRTQSQSSTSSCKILFIQQQELRECKDVCRLEQEQLKVSRFLHLRLDVTSRLSLLSLSRVSQVCV